ncbi:MAG: DNA processing protein, partial [Lentimonas sp.]
CKFAKKIACELNEQGFVIASGMARGIDSSAHQASLEKGTIAVLGGGIDNIYPSENKPLYQQIAQKGLIISENPFGYSPIPSSFPRRNRIVSGISLGVIVVEATIRSGTLITARCANEQGREVFAVPGSPFDPRCQGSNRLIKDGATLIENVDDITSSLIIPMHQNGNETFMEPEGDKFGHFPAKIPNQNDVESAQEIILGRLNHSFIAIDEITNNLQISTRIINVALMQLELSNKIENFRGKICLKA